jgi:hypothetical protein
MEAIPLCYQRQGTISATLKQGGGHILLLVISWWDAADGVRRNLPFAGKAKASFAGDAVDVVMVCHELCDVLYSSAICIHGWATPVHRCLSNLSEDMRRDECQARLRRWKDCAETIRTTGMRVDSTRRPNNASVSVHIRPVVTYSSNWKTELQPPSCKTCSRVVPLTFTTLGHLTCQAM